MTPVPTTVPHIGSCMLSVFVQVHGGITYLRYDDTNPEKEEERFIRGIQEMVRWLGGLQQCWGGEGREGKGLVTSSSTPPLLHHSLTLSSTTLLLSSLFIFFPSLFCPKGHEPYKITFSSDYFDQLYAWAVQLIKRYFS